MDDAFNTLPIIDREDGLTLAGNNQDLADDLLALLIKNLPADLATIQAAHASNNEAELKKLLHKLRGGVAYCGLPRLKSILMTTEANLKEGSQVQISALLMQLNEEVSLLLSHYTNCPPTSLKPPYLDQK